MSGKKAGAYRAIRQILNLFNITAVIIYVLIIEYEPKLVNTIFNIKAFIINRAKKVRDINENKQKTAKTHAVFCLGRK